MTLDFETFSLMFVACDELVFVKSPCTVGLKDSTVYVCSDRQVYKYMASVHIKIY